MAAGTPPQGAVQHAGARLFAALLAKWEYIYFSSERRDSTQQSRGPLTYAELENHIRGILNGGGNIYRISRAMLDSATDSVPVLAAK